MRVGLAVFTRATSQRSKLLRMHNRFAFHKGGELGINLTAWNDFPPMIKIICLQEPTEWAYRQASFSVVASFLASKVGLASGVLIGRERTTELVASRDEAAAVSAVFCAGPVRVRGGADRAKALSRCRPCSASRRRSGPDRMSI